MEDVDGSLMWQHEHHVEECVGWRFPYGGVLLADHEYPDSGASRVARLFEHGQVDAVHQDAPGFAVDGFDVGDVREAEGVDGNVLDEGHLKPRVGGELDVGRRLPPQLGGAGKEDDGD